MRAALRATDVTWAPVGADRSILEAILHARTDIAIWRRALSDKFAHWLDRVSSVGFDDIQLVGRASSVSDGLADRIENWRPHDVDACFAFADDVACLAHVFARLAKSDDIELRLEWVTDNACSRFHRDSTDIRLLATYVGPGTQFVLPPDDMRALAEQAQYPGPLNSVPNGAVALLKGKSAHHCGVLHRSPPIVGTGLRRILLCISQQTEMEACVAGSLRPRS
jgi:hypothetical protein